MSPPIATRSTATRPSARSSRWARTPSTSGMAGGEEVEPLVVERLLAVEGAEEARPAGDARQAVHERLVAELDPEDVALVRLHVKQQPLAGGGHHVLVERVEVGRDAREDRLGHLGPVGLAVQLAPGGLADAGLRGAGPGDDRVEARRRERARRGERRQLERRLDPRELGLEAGERLAEEAERLEEPRRVAPDALGRPEVDDLDREAPADPVEAADALLDHERAPRQVEEHEAPAELEVAALAAALGRDEQARALGASRNCATSMSRRAVESPSWKTPSRAGRGG